MEGGWGWGAVSFRCHNHHSESPATVVYHLPPASGPFLIAKWTKYFSCAANSQWTFSHGKTDMLFFTCSQWTFSRGKMDIAFFTCSQWTFSQGKMDMVFSHAASGPFLMAKWTWYFSRAANSQWTFSHGKMDMVFSHAASGSFLVAKWTWYFSRATVLPHTAHIKARQAPTGLHRCYLGRSQKGPCPAVTRTETLDT